MWIRLLLALGMSLASLPAAGLPADVETGFTSMKTTSPLVVNAISQAERRCWVAVFSLTETLITQTLAVAKARGVDVQIKYDTLQAAQPRMQESLATLKLVKIPLFPIKTGSRAHMHHKFAVIDSEVVVTGSFNWTTNATFRNWENVVVVRSPEVASAYESEFLRIKTR